MSNPVGKIDFLTDSKALSYRAHSPRSSSQDPGDIIVISDSDSEDATPSDADNNEVNFRLFQ